MKKIKRLSLGLVALLSLLSVVVITSSSPGGVQAHDVTEDDANTDIDERSVPNRHAAQIWSFADTATASGDEQNVLWTIDFDESSACNQPIGGTTGSNGFVGESPIANSSYLQTHLNEGGPTNTDAAQSTSCEHTLSITPSLNCAYTIAQDIDQNPVGATNNVVLATVAKRADDDPEDQQTTELTIVGTPFGAGVNNGGNAGTAQDSSPSTIDDVTANFDHDGDETLVPIATTPTAQTTVRDAFFSHERLNTIAGGLGASFPAARAPGVRAGLRDGVPGESQVLPIEGDTRTALANIGGATVLIVMLPTDCDPPENTSNFRLLNAEPTGSLNLAVNIATRGDCTPSSGALTGENEAEIVAPGAGNPLESDNVILTSTCTYNLKPGIASNPGSFFAANGLKTQCIVAALIYEVDPATPATFSARVLSGSRETGQNLIVTDSGFVRRSATGDNIVQMHLFVQSDCPRVVQVSFEYRTTSSAVDQSQDIQVSFTPTANSPAGCVGLPITLESASTNSNDNSVNANLVLRPRGGRTCGYTAQYPLGAGSIQLASEQGADDTDGDGVLDIVDTDTSARRDTRTASNDNRFDGKYTLPALSASGNDAVVFFYQSRRLPISVTSVFPNDTVFTTRDTVDYRISVIRECSRLRGINARVYGASGTFRSIQAYPGETLVFDPSLRNIRAEGTVTINELFEIEPLITVDNITNETAGCTVQVTETSAPSGCTTVGGSVKTITFSEGLDEFAFRFEHDCGTSASTSEGPSSARGLTA